jgi:glycosyltransferase involved in cell wall biosynthesis
MSTVAIMSTYVPSEGFGGPARVLHMREVLERAGHRVVHVVIEANPSRVGARSHDLVRLVERPQRTVLDHVYEDVELGNRAAGDARELDVVSRHLAEQQTSLVILEQPFLVGVAEHVSRQLGTPVVYSSQNVEFRLRRDLERFQPDWRRPPRRSEEVRELEQRAVSLAHRVTAICATDQDALQEEFGVDSTLVPNGSALAGVPVSAPRIAEARDFVFAGSAYWPNIEGFAQIATPSLAFLPPTARIHVAGTAGRVLLEHPDVRRHLAMNRSRLELLGFLEMSELIDAMRSARCVLVPVFVGEGSNLKSADALAAGVRVIMTRRATHGYEDVLAADPSGVTVVDTAAEFRTAMLESLAAPATGAVGARRVRMLDWHARLAPLVGVVESVLPAGAG